MPTNDSQEVRSFVAVGLEVALYARQSPKQAGDWNLMGIPSIYHLMYCTCWVARYRDETSLQNAT